MAGFRRGRRWCDQPTVSPASARSSPRSIRDERGRRVLVADNNIGRGLLLRRTEAHKGERVLAALFAFFVFPRPE